MNHPSLYKHWNFTTAICFKHKTKCFGCPNWLVCSRFEDENRIHPVKKAVIETLKNIGTNGLEKFI